jgi:acetyl-CoA C-acetyltransferase
MLVGSNPRRVAIVGGIRIPFARANGAYAECSNPEMLKAVLRALVERFGLLGQRLGEVAAGATIKHPSQWNLTRESVLAAGLAAETPGLDLQRAGGTSLEAAITLANKIALGQIDSGIAAGVDSISDPPVLYARGFQQLLLRSYRGETLRARAAPWLGLRPRHLRPVLPGLSEPQTGLSPGAATELLAARWRISREDQDRFALDSHARAAEAYGSGFYRDLVSPYRGVAQDDGLRLNMDLERLAGLPAMFAAAGTVTAGTTAPPADGAAAVLLASERWARDRDLPVLAYLRHGKAAAVNFLAEPENALMAPAYVVSQLLADTQLSLQEFDYIEMHEAFAAQVLATLAAWSDPAFCRDRLQVAAPLGRVDRARLNVKGGSLAFGSPDAATGARLLATLAQTLAGARAKRGLVAVCAASGMGVGAILER